jgi:hypothetical protein
MTTKKEMLQDIREMIILISAFTKPKTQGSAYLAVLKEKYSKPKGDED